MQDIKSFIREVPDFPKKGIRFYDITTILQDPAGFKLALDRMEEYVKARGAQKLVAVESRGFIFGAALADRLDLPLVVARKPGKLPFKTISAEYALEYGTDTLEMHSDAVSTGDKVVIVDDLIATGGTLKAVCGMVEQLGGTVAGISSVVALTFLPFEQSLKGYNLDYLVSYDSE